MKRKTNKKQTPKLLYVGGTPCGGALLGEMRVEPPISRLSLVAGKHVWKLLGRVRDTVSLWPQSRR